MKTYVDHELVTVRRVQRLLGFCRDRAPGDFPDALDVALELSLRHLDERRAIGLADLLLEAGLAGDLAEAKRVAVCPPGVALAAALSSLKWRKMRTGKRRAWYPPVRRAVTWEGWGCDETPAPARHTLHPFRIPHWWGGKLGGSGAAGRAVGPT